MEHDVATRATLALPISESCNLRLVSREEGHAQVELDVTETVSIHSGHLNGGELYALLDYAAYLALCPQLREGTAAVTHALQCTIQSAAPRGKVVRLDAKVDKHGRSVAFIRVEARVVGTENIVATATVTKSIISLERRLRHS